MGGNVKLLRPAVKLPRQHHALVGVERPGKLFQLDFQFHSHHSSSCFCHEDGPGGWTLVVHVNKSADFFWPVAGPIQETCATGR